MPNNSRKEKTEDEKKEDKKFHIELVKQMLTLSTAAFGLVAALAWNAFIQELVTSYVKKYLSVGGALLSMGIYAIIVTILAVFVTYQLSRIIKRLENK